MSKRRKRESRQGRNNASEKRLADAPQQLPPANPPKRNPTMLSISLTLFAGWFLFLLYLAFFR